MKIRDLAPFTIRIPLELKDLLQKAASKKLKGSINTEILERLVDSFEGRGDIKKFEDGELIQELINRYGRDGIYIRIGREQEAASAIQDAVNALSEKLADIGGANHDRENTGQCNKNR